MKSRLPEGAKALAYWLVIGAAVTAGILLASVLAAPASAETASWYGHGRVTASGARFDRNAMTAAHRSLPFGTRLRVCRQASVVQPLKRSVDLRAKTQACVVVTVNDRGPFVRGRDLDLSQAAARAIDLTRVGVGRVAISRL